MDIQVAESLAKCLMSQHNLEGWTFKWGNQKRQFGYCSHFNKEICLSKPLTVLNEEEAVKDTILHEIAHALAPTWENHGLVWRRIARSIGCNPERCYDAKKTVLVEAKFIANCPKCGKLSRRFKMTGIVQSCGDCCQKYNGGYFSPEFILKYQLNPNYKKVTA